MIKQMICEKCYKDFQFTVEEVFDILCLDCRAIVGYRIEDTVEGKPINLTEELSIQMEEDGTLRLVSEEDIVDAMRRILNDDTISDGIITQEEYDEMTDEERAEFNGENV